MRRVLVAMTVVAIGVLSSGLAGQARVITNVSEPLAAIVFVPCANGGAGDFIDLSGNLHILMTFTINANAVSGVVHFQPQDVRGYGEESGDIYEGTGVTRQHFAASLTGGRAETSFVNNFLIVGRGGAVDYRVHTTSHLVITATGAVAGVIDDVKVGCS